MSKELSLDTESELRRRLQNATSHALNTLTKNLTCGDKQIEVMAAKALLDAAIKISAIEVEHGRSVSPFRASGRSNGVSSSNNKPRECTEIEAS